MLTIKNLHANVDEKPILKGIDFTVNAGEVHAIMGPNGSGKSTLANVIAGREDYTVTEGSVIYGDQDLLAMPIEERASAGIFMSFQYPVEIPGVSNINFMKTAVNAIRIARGQPEMDALEFLKWVKGQVKFMEMDEAFLYRPVNQGFSGGEKKRNEILQMLILEPSLLVLDETDSGLDIDALKVVSKGVEALRNSDRGIILITHYQRLLDYIKPDYVHVLSAGKIVKSGDKALALELEAQGYGWVTEDES